MNSITLQSKLEFGPQLPVHGHAGSAHKSVPPLIDKLGLAADKTLDKLVLVLPALGGVDQNLGLAVVKEARLLTPDVEFPEVLDIRTIGQLCKQLLPEPEVVVEVIDLGDVDKGDLSWGLEEGVEVKLLVIWLTESDGQGRVSCKSLEYWCRVSEGREQSGGPVPALVCQEGGVNLALERGVEVSTLGQHIARPLVLEHAKVRLGLSQEPGADAVTAGAPNGDPEVLQGLAVLCQLVQLGAPQGDVKHLGAGLAGGEVSHTGYGGGEGLPVTLGEVAEELVSGLATIGRQKECPSYQVEVIF